MNDTIAIKSISIPHISNKVLTYIFGLGLLLFGLHSSVFTVYSSSGATLFFPPFLGIIIINLVTLYLIIDRRITTDTLGEKKIWIPLLLIVISITIRSLLTFTYESFVEIGVGLSLFGCYLSSRVLGKEIFYFLAAFVIVEIISVFIYAIWINPGNGTGGLWSISNYDGATGLIVIGSMLFIHKWQWILVLAMLLTGWFMASMECIAASAIICAFMLIRRDYNKKLFIGIVVIGVLVGSWYIWGYGEQQYEWKVINVAKDALGIEQYEKVYEIGSSKTFYTDIAEDDNGEYLATWGKGRLPAYERAIENTAIFGHEYDMYQYQNRTGYVVVHNVPLVIWDQIGPLAAIMWLWVTLYCLIKKRWKYAIVAIIGISLFDHYIWTTLAPYWWCIIGLVTAHSIDDRIWRKDEYQETV